MKLVPHIRWMIRRDMPEVLEIEQASFEFPWSEEDFVHALRQRNCIGMVAEIHDQVVAFMVYALYREKLHLINFAVHPEVQRQGVGSQMVDKLKRKLSDQRRREIVMEIRETNETAIKFLTANGFRGAKVLQNQYAEIQEDAIVFVFKHKWQKEHPVFEDVCPGGLEPKNRLNEYFAEIYPGE